MPTARRLAAASIAGSLLALGVPPRDARAEPQANAALTIGAAGVGLDRAVWDTTVFHLGLRGDVLFLRDAPSDFGLGPYAELFTHAFDELQLGGGVSALLPVSETLPFVASIGAYGRVGDDGFGLEPGVSAALFWGSRSYNYHSAYGMAGGLLVQGRLGLGSSKETAIIIGAQLDLYILAMPAVFLINAAKGGSPDTAPVR